MENSTQTQIITAGDLSLQVVGHTAASAVKRTVRRITSAWLDAKQIARFWLDGYEVEITRKGWRVVLRNV